MYELEKNSKGITSKFVGTVPSFYKKRIYRAAVSQRLRNTGLEDWEPQPEGLSRPVMGEFYVFLFSCPYVIQLHVSNVTVGTAREVVS